MVIVTTKTQIVTERLSLRPFTSNDLDALTDLYAREEVVRYLYQQRQSREETAAMLDRRLPLTRLEAPGDRLLLAVTERDSGAMVGDVVLDWEDTVHVQGEIGYVFHPDRGGRGYATEAARAMLRLGFEQAGLHRIFGRCDVRNTASARLMERLGMRREAHLVENEWFKGEWGSEFVYAMLAREWEATQG